MIMEAAGELAGPLAGLPAIRKIAKNAEATGATGKLDDTAKKALGKADAPSSGHAPYQRIAVGENELSQAIVNARKVRGDRSGQNWLSFKVKGDDTIHVIRSKGGVHSERRLKKWLELKGIEKKNLESFFSERGPCTYPGRGGCQRFMAENFPDANGYYLFEYFDETTRAASRSDFAKYVRRIFNPNL